MVGEWSMVNTFQNLPLWIFMGDSQIPLHKQGFWCLGLSQRGIFGKSHALRPDSGVPCGVMRTLWGLQISGDVWKIQHYPTISRWWKSYEILRMKSYEIFTCTGWWTRTDLISWDEMKQPAKWVLTKWMVNPKSTKLPHFNFYIPAAVVDFLGDFLNFEPFQQRYWSPCHMIAHGMSFQICFGQTVYPI